MDVAETLSKDEIIAALQEQVRELKEENARLKSRSDERMARPLAALQALQKVNNSINSSLDLDQILTLTVETVAEVTTAEFCSIFLIEDRDRLVLRATKGLNPAAVGRVAFRVGEGITGATAKERRSIALREATADPRYCYIALLQEEKCRSMLSVPIILYSMQKLIGVLVVQTLTPRDFVADEIRFMENIAGQIAMAIENGRLYQQTDDKLHQRIVELTTLHRVSNMIASTLDVREVLDLITSQAVSLSSTDAAVIFQLDEDGETIFIPAAHGLKVVRTDTWRTSLTKSLIGRVISSGQPMVIPDLRVVPDLQALARLAREEGLLSLAMVPLTTTNGAVGGLAFATMEPRGFSDDEMRLLSIFADQAAIAIENAQLYADSQRNLAVKTALLSEMHHRVKNNLQTVAALLSLQARRSQSWQASAPLRESVARIQSIAAVHDLLSQRQIGKASVDDVARKVMEVAIMSPVRPGIKVDFRIEGGDASLGSRQATVFALLMNELIANAVAHGFADRDEGTITIRAAADNDVMVITVHDNGRGLPDEFVLQRDAGLGLQIVGTLVDTDLQGQFSITSNGGTTATVTFRQ